ncbi:MAG: hypothetical protein ACFCVA_10135 [Gammaproteobacteria bacterium]
MGKDGKPAMPREATELLRNSHLQPNEVREFEDPVPASPALGIIRAEQPYNLLTPTLIERFGDQFAAHLKQPRLAASAEFRP